MSEAESAAYCGRVFAPDLEGEPLRTNRSLWTNFPMLRNETWRHENVALLGDAAHTAHFSIGSGTKLAMEDAIALAYALHHAGNVESALAAYEEERQPSVARFQRAAFESLWWFEKPERYLGFEPDQFAFSLLTRSRRLSYETLKVRDPEIVERVHDRFVRGTGAQVQDGKPLPPPMFTPFHVRDLRLPNRIVVSAMSMYSAEDGTPNDWHLVHLGSRAVGGAGLVITEMTDVSRQARISPGCAGLYKREQVAEWRRIVEFVHRWTGAKIAMQLGHAGRKGSTRRLWEGDNLPLPDGNWPIVSASAIPYYVGISQIPREISREQMDQVREDYVRAARWAQEAGFDMLELHYAHGYLMASFISPLTNQRTDEYGGDLEHRLHFPLEVFDSVRTIWPADKPISVSLTVTDCIKGGLDVEDAVIVSKILKIHGCDILMVLAGQTTPDGEPSYDRGFLTPLSERIRNEAGIPTIVGGYLTTTNQVNTIIAAGRADFCIMNTL
jgi:anthraniloyl-CoA monooxygenase